MTIRYTFKWFFNNADSISTWFDTETFEWPYSYLLAEFCSKDFDLWWDTDKFNWRYSYDLARHCSSDCDKWFVHSKYYWGDKFDLVKHCIQHIDIWYDPADFTESYDELLLMSIK